MLILPCVSVPSVLAIRAQELASSSIPWRPWVWKAWESPRLEHQALPGMLGKTIHLQERQIAGDQGNPGDMACRTGDWLGTIISSIPGGPRTRTFSHSNRESSSPLSFPQMTHVSGTPSSWSGCRGRSETFWLGFARKNVVFCPAAMLVDRWLRVARSMSKREIEHTQLYPRRQEALPVAVSSRS